MPDESIVLDLVLFKTNSKLSPVARDMSTLAGSTNFHGRSLARLSYVQTPLSQTIHSLSSNAGSCSMQDRQ